jgi:hypothetical protein
MIKQPFFVPAAIIPLFALPLVLGLIPRNRGYGFRTQKPSPMKPVGLGRLVFSHAAGFKPAAWISSGASGAFSLKFFSNMPASFFAVRS